MRCGKQVIRVLVGGSILATLSGCVSMDRYQRLETAHRRVLAEKQQVEAELFDARSVTGGLRDKADHLDRERAANEALLANLRGENELLEQFASDAQAAAEQMAARQALAPITISGPALPKQLDSALRAFADRHPSAVVYDSASGTIKWQSDLLFAFASDAVSDASKQLLRDFTGIVNSASAESFEVIVVGHTDNRPIKNPGTREKHPTNWHLSAHRAIAVAQTIINNGYSPARIGIMGCGEFRPVADNATQAGAGLNRRVEIFIVPVGTLTATAGVVRLDADTKTASAVSP